MNSPYFSPWVRRATERHRERRRAETYSFCVPAFAMSFRGSTNSREKIGTVRSLAWPITELQKLIVRSERSWLRMEQNIHLAPLSCSIYPEILGDEEWNRCRIQDHKGCSAFVWKPRHNNGTCARVWRESSPYRTTISCERRAKICWGARNF